MPKFVFLGRQRMQLAEPAGLALLETHSQSPLTTASPGADAACARAVPRIRAGKRYPFGRRKAAEMRDICS